jgi:hypothetical protein
MAIKINTHPAMLDELLTEINESTDVVGALKHAFKESYFKGYMELAVNDVFPSFDIDDIKFKQYDYHRSMAGAFCLNRQSWNIVSNVIMADKVAVATKKKQYKSLSEMLYIGECAAFTAIIKKDIASIYPNITFAAINEALNAE